MKWTVLWIPSAEKNLADLWINGLDRPQITAAADTIDQMLAKDPLSAGESREGNERILFVSPLAVTFEVDPGDLKATVTAVWRPE